jgi:hypothetical protein
LGIEVLGGGLSSKRRIYLAILAEISLTGFAFTLVFFDPSDWGLAVKLAAVFAAMAASSLIGYLQIAKPFMASRHSYVANVMDVLVEGFLAKYAEYHPSTPPELRINFMLEEWDVWPWRRILMISYHFQPDDQSAYSLRERDLAFEIGQGNCGRAFERRELRFFERDSDPLKRREQDEHYRLTAEQAHVLDEAEIGSVLSVPVFHPNDQNRIHPIGVINVDSSASLENSLFDQAPVQNQAIRLASAAGILFH